MDGVRFSGYPLESKAAAAGVRRYSMLATIALLAIACGQLVIYLAHRETRHWVLHSRQVATTALRAQALSLDREAALQSFLASHETQTLVPEIAARGELARALDDLIASTADNPTQQGRARGIKVALARWDSAFAGPVLAGVAASQLTGPSERSFFEAIRLRFAEFLAGEESLHQQRLARDEFLDWIGVTGILLPLLVLSLIFLALGRRLTAQTETLGEQQQQLEEQAVELEQQVQELEITNRELAESAVQAARAGKEAERLAAERERVMAQLDATLLSAPIGFAFHDLDLRYIRVNPAFAALRKKAVKEIEGQTLRDICPAPIADTIEEHMRRVIVTGEPVVDVRLVFDAKDEHPRRELMASYYPVRTAAGQLIGVGAVVVDVSERAELEAQMRQAQKMEAVGRLAGGIAHDFNNLLTVIRSYCDLVLLESGESAPAREEMLEIRSAADRAADLARQLLAFSRRQVLLPRVLDLNEVVTSLDAMLGRLLSGDVHHTLRLGPGLGKVKADAGQVEQVLMNLAINAADAMPDGGTLTIETANTTLDTDDAKHHAGVVPGDYVMIAIADTGTGMDDITLARIFEPFFTTKPPGKGTGLGLSTVYGIVHQVGGHIRVASEVGKGTTFTVYLPRTEEDVIAPQPATTGRPVTPRASETVLIVEDEPSVRSTLTRILERRGYRVLGASHGGEAMRVAAEHDGAIHLVISDLMMPEMSGREFIQRFSTVRPDTRVLFMSGYTDDDVAHRGLVDEHQAFIQKPFALEEITRKVRDVIEQR